MEYMHPKLGIVVLRAKLSGLFPEVTNKEL